MHETGLLRDALLLAGTSLVVLLLFQRLRLPAAAGFIVTGIVLGPAGLGLIQDPALLDAVAELGVLLLLFTVGLEFSLADLRRLGGAAVVSGGVQVVGTLALAAGVLVAAGLHPARAVFFGMLIALSSTALVFKLLADRLELSAPHGRRAAAVLLFQDLMVIPFAFALPELARWYTGSARAQGGGGLRSLAMLGALAVAFVGAQRAVPWLVRRASRADSREAFLFGTGLVALGSAWLAGLAGLSPALGAFIAGLTLARSELREQIAADVLPLRDVFSSLFFVSIGTMLQRDVVLTQPLLVFGGAAALVALKVAAALVALRLGGASWRVAVAAAIALAQVGEFSFVLARTTAGTDLMGPFGRPVFVAAAVISLMLTPLLVARAPGWALALDVRWSRRRPVRERALPPDATAEEAAADEVAPHSSLRSGHVVIAGFGLNGHNLARVLRAVHVPHLVLDLDPETVLEAGGAGSPALVGDVTQPFIQKQAGISRAEVLVLALSDPTATRHACRVARALAPGLFIIVRTRYVNEIDELFRLGANQVIPEEFETSIEIFTATLRHLHVPGNVIDAQVRLLREERYSLLRGMKLPQSVVEQLETILQQGTCDTFVLLQHSPAVGRRLDEAGLLPPGEGMARAIALVRGGMAVTALDDAGPLRVGDILVLAGTHADMDRTFRRLHPSADGGSPGGL